MKVFNFDIKKGIYSFEINDLNSENHSHPTIEIIYAIHGSFSLETGGQKETNVTFAIIDSNLRHKIISQNCTAKLLMIESNNELFGSFLKQDEIQLINGMFIDKKGTVQSDFLEKTKLFALNNDLKKVKDDRIQKCLNVLDNEVLAYDKLISTLTSSIFLSESRLSHLFKENIGISVKKYLVWSRLKKSVHLILNEGVNLTEAAHQSGFFDQAHLSNTFKKVLGITPSKAYNSRILQF